MMSTFLQRPQPHESSDYYKNYIRQVEGQDILSTLKHLQSQTEAFFQSIPTDKWTYAYAPGKWTIKELVIHLLDTERIMAYRALRIARNDQTPMPGFEQDDYVPQAFADKRSVASLIEEYRTVRAASITL
ncbi:MAG: DinB family protein, partial [Bacteroidota bacterium]